MTYEKPNQSGQQFLDRYSILDRSGVGVLFARTKEPLRAVGLLHEFAKRKDIYFAEWNNCVGWRIPDNDVDKPAVIHPVCDFGPALAAIVEGDDGNSPMGRVSQGTVAGMFVMQSAHWYVVDDNVVVQRLRLYAHLFSETDQRLILLVPDTFTPPVDLQNDIPMIDLPLPGREELIEIYHRVVPQGIEDLMEVEDKPKSRRRDPEEITEYDASEVERIASLGAGMTAMEYETGLSKSLITNISSLPLIPLESFCDVLHQTKVEVVHRSNVLRLLKPKPIEQLGGLTYFKEWLAYVKAAYEPDARAFGVPLPRGLVMVGPPGCGKTLGVQVIGSVLEMPVVLVDLKAAKGPYVGESERALRAAFNVLRDMAPCVAFVDELENAGIGGGGDSGVSAGFLQSLLLEMGGEPTGIYWVLAGNDIEGMPPQLLRRGRTDEIWAFLPPNREGRRSVLDIHLRECNHDIDDLHDVERIIDSTDGYVPAELAACVGQAVTKAYVRNIALSTELILTEVHTLVPIKKSMATKYERMLEWALNNARFADMPDDAAGRKKVQETTYTDKRRKLHRR